MLLNMSVPSYLWVPSLLLPCYLQPQIPAVCEAVNKYESGRLKDILWLAFRFQSICQTPSISLLIQGSFSIMYWPCLSQLAAWDRAVLYPRADACAFSATALHLVQATEALSQTHTVRHCKPSSCSSSAFGPFTSPPKQCHLLRVFPWLPPKLAIYISWQ